MDPADASFWRVRLDPIDEPADRGPLPDVDAAVANALGEPLRPRARGPRAGERDDERGVPRQPEAARRAARDVVSRQRPRRHAVPAHRRLSGRRDRHARPKFRRRARPGVHARLSDVERRRHGELSARPQLRRGQPARAPKSSAGRRRSGSRASSSRPPKPSGRRPARCAARPSASTRRAPARRWREQRLDAEQRRFEVGLSTTFLVTQAQRDLLQAQVNLLQTMLDYSRRSSTSRRCSRRRRSAPATRSACAARRSSRFPTPTPRGLFRAGAAMTIGGEPRAFTRP